MKFADPKNDLAFKKIFGNQHLIGVSLAQRIPALMHPLCTVS